MKRSRRQPKVARPPATPDRDAGPEPDGTGGFLGQVGLFETANGLPHGPLAIVVAVGLAILTYPTYLLSRVVRRR
jgi:hypothetical protein